MKVQRSMDANGGARWSCGIISSEGSVKMAVVIDDSVQDSSHGIRAMAIYCYYVFSFFENKKPVEFQCCITFCCKDPNFAM